MGDEMEAFNTVKEYSIKTGKKESDGTITHSDMKKAFKDKGLDKYNPVMESSVWAKVAGGTKPVKCDRVVPEVLPMVAKMYKERTGAKEKRSEEDILKELVCSLKGGKVAAKGAGVSGKAAASVDRMTDTSKYTGAHKERFDADGKGKGSDGRVEKADSSGYVGNYKGAGTFDKKH